MKAYILLCDGFEEVEALATADILKRAGIETELVSPYGQDIVRGSHNFGVTVDAVFASADKYDSAAFGDADAVILPGGMPGTTNLGKSAAVCEMIKNYNERGKLVCAICAAPSVLGANGILDGHEATCFPGFENALGAGKHIGGPAVVSGNVVTGKSMGCAIDFAVAIVAELLGTDAAGKVEASVYRS